MSPRLVWHGGAVLIYKILLPTEWAAFEDAGRFDGSPFDDESGFIHLSSREQVAATALRVFGNEPELVVVAVDTQVVDESLRWEESATGASSRTCTGHCRAAPWSPCTVSREPQRSSGIDPVHAGYPVRRLRGG